MPRVKSSRKRQARHAGGSFQGGCGETRGQSQAGGTLRSNGWGGLDILVPNAGIWNLEDLPIEKMSEKQWDDMIRINLKSVYSVIHFAVPHMIKQKSGKIIPISSTAGQRGESFHTHYGASKGGIISLTKGLSTELARHGILVNSVAPGWVATDMSNPVLDTKAGKKMAAGVIPLGRAGDSGGSGWADPVSGVGSGELH